MLINSKFRDFYDNCAAYGVDTAVVYRRETEEVINPRSEIQGRFLEPNPQVKVMLDACHGWGPSLGHYWDWKENTRRERLSGEVYVLGLAGTLYKFLHWTEWTDGMGGHRNRSEFLAEDMPVEFAGKFSSFRDTQPLLEHFSKIQSRDNVDVFTTLGCPVFIGMEGRIFKNPNLRDFDLTRLKDGVTVFQEISSFISGTLNCAGQMKHVASDQELIQAHGFDKRSFRKGSSRDVKR